MKPLLRQASGSSTSTRNVEGAIRYVESTRNRSVDHGFSLTELPHMSSGSRQSVDRDLPEFTLSPCSRRVQRCRLARPPPHSDHPPCGQFLPEQVPVNTPFEGYAHGGRGTRGQGPWGAGTGRPDAPGARTRYLNTHSDRARPRSETESECGGQRKAWQATIVVSSYQIKNVLNVTALVTRAVVNCWDG